MLFNKQSKLGLLAVALALSGTVLGLQSTNASAYGPVRVDHLHVTVVGEAPLLHLSNKQNEFVLDGNTLSVNYSYQHAETIEFELINQADSSIRATKLVDVSKKSTYGDDIVSLNLSTRR